MLIEDDYLPCLQLYNLSLDPERKEFLDKLFNYMQSKGTAHVSMLGLMHFIFITF